MGEEKKLFVRKATGLVREIGYSTAIIIVIACVVGLGWQKRLFQWTGRAIVPESAYFMGLAPITVSFIIVGVIILLTAYVWAVLAAAMPRSGGGYVFISRIIHPFAGFAVTWLEFFSVTISWGLIATAVFEASLIYAWILGWGTSWATPETLLVGGIILSVLFSLLASRGASMTGKLLQMVFWIPAAITVVLYGLMMAATPVAMEVGIKAITGIAPIEFTKMALTQGMADKAVDYQSAIAITSIGAYSSYIGWNASVFVGGEVKGGSKTLPRTLLIANFIIVLIYISISFLGARAATMVGKVGDFSFFSAYAFMSYGGGHLPPGVGNAWTPNVAAFAASGMGLYWALALLPIFAVLWVANDMPPMILQASRTLFAMSFDRTLPEKLSEVNERWHSPTNAILVSMVIAFVGCFAESDFFIKYPVPVLTAYINSAGAITCTDIWETTFGLFGVLSGLLIVFRRKDIFELSPFRPSKSLMILVASAATVANIYMLYLVAKGYPSPEPWIFTALLLIVGAAVYFYYRKKGEQAGVDYATIYATIPPE